ncbi:TetR/AcrR family transcriptional regulator [Ligilactobacillus sp. WILCCON 0076]|uniref:TetR/AcrR family transcriptional regulator n=1 Tax=Ligilactobacillus ubinensis TaxID=2876789 RepID=A0A9X2FL99_9LACO|nr:TetR/AcrR family transcriptional regulator [Ligilactobacillus ubinensis]MCP0886613.1 TetR/AcrR family transcriptional regulator [Ligilactobacillus ubinensis]
MDDSLSIYKQRIIKEDMPAGKKKVFKAALELIAKNGLHATTTAKIAKQAGVSEGTIYKYFASKEDLLAKLLIPILTEIRDTFFLQSKTFDSLEEVIHFVIKDRLEFVNVNFDFIKIVLREILDGHDLSIYFQDVIIGEGSIVEKLADFKKRFPEIRSELTSFQIMRIFMGPLLVFVSQERLLSIPSSNKKSDTDLIERQIIAGLTGK